MLDEQAEAKCFKIEYLFKKLFNVEFGRNISIKNVFQEQKVCTRI